jgi:hypothetical protein
MNVRMKTIIKILILTLVIYLSYTLVTGAQTTPAGNPPQDRQTGETGQEEDLSMPEYNGQEGEEDEMDFLGIEDSLSRRLHLKDLPPLTKKEKIIWSFRMAETNSFL